MQTDEYYCHQDEVDQAAADLAEYELFVYQQKLKARALLVCECALEISDPFVAYLTWLVQEYAVPHSDSNLGEMLRDTVAELLISSELQESVLQQPINRAGYIEIRRILDAACIEFEALLAAEDAR